MGFPAELGRPHVGYPDLHRAEPLGAKPATVFAHPSLAASIVLGRSHDRMLHVTPCACPALLAVARGQLPLALPVEPSVPPSLVEQPVGRLDLDARVQLDRALRHALDIEY